jgi:signal transduction protein with GAF and PtsI domain
MLDQTFELTVRQLCEEVLSEPDPRALPDKIINHVQRTFPIEWSTLWLTEQTEASGELRLRLAAASGPAEKLKIVENGRPAVYNFGEGLTGEIAKRRETINITKPKDFQQYPHKYKYDQVMYDRPKAGELCRCVLGVPLLLRTNIPGRDEPRVIGVLRLENVRQTSTHKEAFFTAKDVEIVEGYAAVIAVALEKARMRADSIRIGQGLLRVSQSLLEGLGAQPDFDNIVRQTANVISAEACALWLRSGYQLRLKAAYGYPGTMLDVPPYDLRLGVDSVSWGFNTAVTESEIKRCGRVGLTVFVASAPSTE